MIDPAQFCSALESSEFRFFTGVPDSLLKDLLAYITATYPADAHVIAANEGNAVVPGVGAFFDDITVELVAICDGDLDGDGDVGAADLAALLGSWGACDEDCPADLDGDQIVGAADLAILLGNWGPCV